MGVSSRGGLFGYLARLGRPPAADSDADLLDRFRRDADQDAFAAIVRRHGPMVLATCRRRLGGDADAEDAFQAVFLALARQAGSVGRESLPGWLYRVAYLISLKAAGRRARHPLAAIDAAEVPMPDPPTSAAEADELKAAIDAGLAGLPDKFRAVVVLCLVEGRTNTEAAAVLGVPVGTVDSRLNTARKRLQAVLTRRGVAVSAGLSLQQVLGGPVSAAGPRFHELASHTIQAVLAEAAVAGAGAVSPAVAELARGVTTMTTKLRMLAAVGVTLGVLGGAGAGVYFATAADDPARPVAKVAADPQAKTPVPADKPADPTQPAKDAKPADRPEDARTAATLAKPFGLKIGGPVDLRSLLEQIEDTTDLVVRVDVAAFRRMGWLGDGEGGLPPEQFLQNLYETKAVLPRKVEKLAIREVLDDALAQFRPQAQGQALVTYQVRGSQLVIVPAYIPPVRPGRDPLNPDPNAVDEDPPLITARELHEQIYGGVVSVAADRKPLPDVLADLRKQTGANIVLDPRCVGQNGPVPEITVTLSDARLYDALRVIADMAQLKMVYAGNIYYVTTPENAKTFQPDPKPLAPPPGFGGLGGGIGGVGGLGGGQIPPPPGKE